VEERRGIGKTPLELKRSSDRAISVLRHPCKYNGGQKQRSERKWMEYAGADRVVPGMNNESPRSRPRKSRKPTVLG